MSRRLKVAIVVSLLRLVTAHAADDCTTWCSPAFGPGVGVTCQAAVAETGPCLKRCWYENGWGWDPDTGEIVRAPQPGGGDQRPRLVDVPPYGYATAFGYQVNAWGPCPGNYFGTLPTPAHVWEWCQAVARGEYHEGEAWCSQWEAP